jgi:allantoate deiminase
MVEEEGGRFGGGLFGSRAMAGKVSSQELATFADAKGISIADAMRSFGFDPEKVSDAVRRPEQVEFSLGKAIP